MCRIRHVYTCEKLSIFANFCNFFFLSLSMSMCAKHRFFFLNSVEFCPLVLYRFYTLAHIVDLPTAITTFKNIHQWCELFVFISCCFVGFVLFHFQCWSCTRTTRVCGIFSICVRLPWWANKYSISFSRIFLSSDDEYRGIVECCDSYWHRQEIRFTVPDNIHA